MTIAIVETNVAVIANDQNDEVVETCVDSCKQFLIEVYENRSILLDDAGDVLVEYIKAISDGRPHGFGARFLFHVLQNQYDPARCTRLNLQRDTQRMFADFPGDPRLDEFDRTDRKFAVLSLLSNVAVTNATDSDWVNFRVPLQENGIRVDFLCSDNPEGWFAE